MSQLKNKSRHYCHAINCKTPTQPRMFMCLKHWRKVPKDLQQKIWKEYTPGQEITKTPTVKYMATALAAIFAVADKEQIEYNRLDHINRFANFLQTIYTTEELNQLIEDAKSK